MDYLTNPEAGQNLRNGKEMQPFQGFLSIFGVNIFQWRVTRFAGRVVKTNGGVGIPSVQRRNPVQQEFFDV